MQDLAEAEEALSIQVSKADDTRARLEASEQELESTEQALEEAFEAAQAEAAATLAAQELRDEMAAALEKSEEVSSELRHQVCSVYRSTCCKSPQARMYICCCSCVIYCS